MKKKILWLGLSFLLVAALVLASCGEAAPGEQEEEEEEEEEPVVEEEEEEEPVGEQEEEEEEEEEPAVGVPQYGGVPVILNRTGPHAGIPDPAFFGYPALYFFNPVLERIMRGDLEKYGLGRGGYEVYDWAIRGPAPLKYLTGALAESWEVTAERIVLNIRPGVYFSGISINPVMESREYTADDYVFNLLRHLSMPTGERLIDVGFIKTPYEEHIYAEDDYTVVIETKWFNPDWWLDIIHVWGQQQIAPESIEAGAGVWENIVGTGAFTIKEFVPGSHIEYGRNPLYWRKTTINGVEYELPFLDGMIQVIMDDEATAVAALRTGAFDAYLYADWVYVDSLTATSPELLSAKTPAPGTFGIEFRIDIPPFNNREVRRALFLGTDRASITRMVMGQDTMHEWPLRPGFEGFVPLEEFPPEDRMLDEYNVDLARQMLAEAGYPDGFKAKVIVTTRPLTPELAEMIAGVWLEDFGIELELEVVETALLTPTIDKMDHNARVGWLGTGASGIIGLRSQFYSGLASNMSLYSNPYFDEMLDKAVLTIDAAERVAILEELFKMMYAEAIFIPFEDPVKLTYWWPWLKNYFGEKGVYWHNPPYDMMWFDQDLKAEMGY